jgi:hypothetical protein
MAQTPRHRPDLCTPRSGHNPHHLQLSKAQDKYSAIPSLSVSGSCGRHVPHDVVEAGLCPPWRATYPVRRKEGRSCVSAGNGALKVRYGWTLAAIDVGRILSVCRLPSSRGALRASVRVRVDSAWAGFGLSNPLKEVMIPPELSTGACYAGTMNGAKTLADNAPRRGEVQDPGYSASEGGAGVPRSWEHTHDRCVKGFGTCPTTCVRIVGVIKLHPQEREKGNSPRANLKRSHFEYIRCGAPSV